MNNESPSTTIKKRKKILEVKSSDLGWGCGGGREVLSSSPLVLFNT
jgi:hypothetical protein